MPFEYQCQNCKVIGDLDEYVEQVACPNCGGIMTPVKNNGSRAQDFMNSSTAVDFHHNLEREQSLQRQKKPIKVAKAVDMGFGGMLTNPSSTGGFSPITTAPSSDAYKQTGRQPSQSQQYNQSPVQAVPSQQPSAPKSDSRKKIFTLSKTKSNLPPASLSSAQNVLSPEQKQKISQPSPKPASGTTLRFAPKIGSGKPSEMAKSQQSKIQTAVQPSPSAAWSFPQSQETTQQSLFSSGLYSNDGYADAASQQQSADFAAAQEKLEAERRAAEEAEQRRTYEEAKIRAEEGAKREAVLREAHRLAEERIKHEKEEGERRVAEEKAKAERKAAEETARAKHLAEEAARRAAAETAERMTVQIEKQRRETEEYLRKEREKLEQARKELDDARKKIEGEAILKQAVSKALDTTIKKDEEKAPEAFKPSLPELTSEKSNEKLKLESTDEKSEPVPDAKEDSNGEKSASSKPVFPLKKTGIKNMRPAFGKKKSQFAAAKLPSKFSAALSQTGAKTTETSSGNGKKNQEEQKKTVPPQPPEKNGEKMADNKKTSDVTFTGLIRLQRKKKTVILIVIGISVAFLCATSFVLVQWLGRLAVRNGAMPLPSSTSGSADPENSPMLPPPDLASLRQSEFNEIALKIRGMPPPKNKQEIDDIIKLWQDFIDKHSGAAPDDQRVKDAKVEIAKFDAMKKMY